MNVLVTGASGLIGSALTAELERGGDAVRRLTRGLPGGPAQFRWDPAAGDVEPAALEQLDAAVHLAGESVAGRWTDAKKERILRSRVDGTRTLASALASAEHPPRVLVCASAIGYYGDRGDELLTEASPPGDDFLAEVVKQWEAASEPAEQAGIRVVRLRFGIVLSRAGGALGTMLLPFRLGVGGKIGSGRQWMSWVSIDDVVGAIRYALMTETLAGACNTVAPDPVTNAEFTKALGRALHRPAVLPVPGFAARAALGEFSGEVLKSTRVVPARLTESGYSFRHTQVDAALRDVLGR
jgi:uncharacterized protein (TIGR01777 family)